MTDTIETSICPSCHKEKVTNHDLCSFCYFRGRTNTLKMTILGILASTNIKDITANEARKLKAKDFKKFSPAEIVEEFDKLDFVKRKANPRSIRTFLIRYTKFKILSASKVRTNKVGRPKILYRLTVRGAKIFAAYIKLWNLGGILLLHKKHRKLKIKADWSSRSSAIRGLMHNPSYNTLDFMFPQRSVCEEKALPP